MKLGKLRKVDDGYLVYCPGCKTHHLLDSRWSLTGDKDNPTFRPSILVNAEKLDTCHSFITNGQWQFLNDCSHELAGKIVDLESV
ncbi:DUF6527 family protein [Pseudanabaena sp. 'Roaring Creek']|uniref:DUF6527 family protein n=1 Tax=Pseudanabaena sp. 'Roaring Creek' TaxID=1681830 RepID=UPI00092F967B|nr:DUF6527 family protein [Pseudanabaena sp. 'Roaring Creek']